MSFIKHECDHREKLLAIFKKAIESEQRAQKSYKEALQYCDNPLIKGVLQKLYDDEVIHEALLLEYYNQLRKKYDPQGQPL